jgi:lipopolysaccharide/colanic/teichoic acid biosynthesis glycosyltransferase
VNSYRGKRLLDLTVSIPALVISLPIQALVALAIRVRLGKPVLFRQTRPGLHGEPFELVKFRTMLPLDPTRGWCDDRSRMTPFGAFLRSTSLDELPTLWNIVRGDMSIVGPRPLLMSYIARYSAEQARRHEVRPGLTGLAQVSGRNAVAWDDRLRLDIDYVERASLILDLRIIRDTVRAVLSREGIAEDGQATMTEFMGPSEPGRLS